MASNTAFETIMPCLDFFMPYLRNITIQCCIQIPVYVQYLSLSLENKKNTKFLCQKNSSKNLIKILSTVTDKDKEKECSIYYLRTSEIVQSRN